MFGFQEMPKDAQYSTSDVNSFGAGVSTCLIEYYISFEVGMEKNLFRLPHNVLVAALKQELSIRQPQRLRQLFFTGISLTYQFTIFPALKPTGTFLAEKASFITKL